MKDFLNLEIPLEPFIQPEESSLVRFQKSFIDPLMPSVAIPSSAFVISPDCDSYSSSHLQQQEEFRRTTEKHAEEFAKPEGQLHTTFWNNVSTTTASSSSKFDIERLKEIMRDAKHTFTGQPIGSLKLCSSLLMGQRKQFRFPKSKKKRIRRKRAKRPENYRFVPDPTYVIIGDGLYAHPATLKKLKDAIVASGGSAMQDYNPLTPCF